MPASSTGTAPILMLPSYSRSHEGPGGGSSDQSSRRNHRASSALPAEFVWDARLRLLDQRAFRIDQLNRLDTTSDTNPDVEADPARAEIEATLREAAHLVLAWIDAALRRIEHGNYGHCQRCGDLMSLDRLTALPMATWCGSCQHTQETASVEPSPVQPRRAPRDGRH